MDQTPELVLNIAPPPPMAVETKRCTLCGRDVPLADYYGKKVETKRKFPYCPPCARDHANLRFAMKSSAKASEVLREAETLINCPECGKDLPEAAFGVVQARKSGRNLYCKSCIRKKSVESRKAFKEYGACKERIPEELRLRYVRKLTPADRVRQAIENGARTQKEIAQGTRLSKDEVGDALAHLLLWTKEIRTAVVDKKRVYLLSEPRQSKSNEPSPPGFSFSTLSFPSTPVIRAAGIRPLNPNHGGINK